MKSGFLILFLLLFASVSEAQDACAARSKDAFALHNLRLGMSGAEARSALGGRLKIKIKNKGERTFFQNFIKKPSPPVLPGARALYLRFFRGRLYQIELFYENRSEWPTLEDFTRHLSATLDLPSVWPTAKSRSTLQCGETSFVADFILNPRVELTDETARAEVEAARKDEEKKKS